MLRVHTVSLVALVLIVMSAPARAQDIPYDNYLVGDRALGLGGAFVALAEDASATFHNPAGLSLVPTSRISASFWVEALQHRELDGGWLTTEGISDLSDTQLTSPPMVVTAVARLGKEDIYGKTRHALGMAIIKPLRLRYRYAALADGGGTGISALDVIHRDNARWYGASYAYQFPYRISFGFSAFAAWRTITHEEIELHGQEGAPQPTPEGYALTRHSVFSASLRHLVWRFGMTWDPNSEWRLGLMFQLPGIAIGGSATNRERTLDIDETGNSTVSNVESADMRTRRPIPWEARVGLTWFFAPRALVTADISILGPVGSAANPIELVPSDDFPLPRLMSFEAHRNTSVRVALGGEYVYRKRYPMRGGVLFYSSGMPDVPQAAGVFTASDMNTIGLSASAGLVLDGRHQVSIGTATILSWGDGSALDQTGAGPASYLSASTSEATLLVYISGGTRAVKEAARTIVEKGEEWIEIREKQRNGDSGSE